MDGTKRSELILTVTQLVASLELAMSWIDNWDTGFSDDPEWTNDSKPKILDTIAKAKSLDWYCDDGDDEDDGEYQWTTAPGK